MARGWSYGALSVLALLAGIGPALAQDAGGLLLTFGIEERLESGSNPGLTIPSGARSTAATTRLSFGLSSETRVQKLSLALSAGARLATGSTGIDAPKADLSYTRTGSNATLALEAHGSRDRLSAPAVIGNLSDPHGAGDVTNYAAKASLDIGTASPLGLTLEAGRAGVAYSGTSNPDLFASQTDSYGVTGHLRFGTGDEARLVANGSRYTAQDSVATRRVAADYEVGLSHALSSAATLDVALGYGSVETRDSSPSLVTTKGVTGHVALNVELANGTAGASLAQVNEPGSQRMTLQGSRAFDLATGSVAAELGVTQASAGSGSLVGSLAWQQDVAAGKINARVARAVASTAVAAETATTSLSLDLSHDVSSRAALGLTLNLARIDDSSANLVKRYDLTARYSYAVTPDWNMDLGLTLQRRTEATIGTAKSQLVFLTISRSFDIRP